MTKNVLKDLGLYKNKLISMLINSSEIYDALCENNSTYTDSSELIFSQIYPYLYVDETQTEVLTYICVETSVPRIPTGTIKDVKLIIWVYSHKEDMKYHVADYVGTKVDIVSDIVERIISSEENCYRFGIGKPELINVDYFFPQNKYYGRQMIYNIPDFKVKETKS
ncbi:hypothetical protein H8S37_04625 [Mediterraneibacter sp. NSJ-55]|uniref:Uncharacterized protein n=1 Tax=Mediterraneibacter hominis TaxID=2763054 RepID=A0A923LGA9_9FIRM|nr:hypothetical protein [Mediterraneibacter hominis]MBC5688213.1 hypothetical protein [Mediterraneibacter hominis]